MSSNRSGPKSVSSTPAGLPVLGAPVRERADAARNRIRVLEAAEKLFAERGVDAVTMDDVAGAAGVGKGTLYRRFGDKGGLAMALLDERERELQERIITGPPPLGPGAEPADRVGAFIEAYLELLDRQLDLVLLSETATTGARFRTGAHALWRRHCRHLLEAGGAEDAEIAADVLLAALSAEQVRHWRQEREMSSATLAESLVRLARTWLR
ncbi:MULTISPECIES: helix-turn-helix domain-containing protein [unclassified Amycolatopsis]|uniref:TetR/AcrR family transcriptional regulator n=1 Tax=unclassified Amycolatopsis TaxID=2618356 RepID=UPI002875221B|nr:MULTISPECIES: helix-turn-helix domain-containing protein [unclassified Amycolatopsis]MDS0136929.1 TetR/AcrR family transcriptional regulator [Amycolatopsis sp. 505]MDS0143594.1 TetR/AcrR family transcriptional regulator [Amycolatopsis sp. CM201R]